MRNPVRSHKLKFDGTHKGPWHGDLVQVHPDGWLVVFYEEPPQMTDSGARAAYGLRYHGTRQPVSVLVYFAAGGDVLEYHCDAAFPATIDGREIAFVDLDIDLIVAPDFSWHERDHDDFAHNRVAMGYSSEAIATAEAGLRMARQLVESRAAPFNGEPAELLGRVLAERGQSEGAADCGGGAGADTMGDTKRSDPKSRS